MLFNIKTKKQYCIFFLLIIVVAVLFFPKVSFACGISSVYAVSDCVAEVVNFFLQTIIWVLGVFLGIIGWLLDTAISFTDLRSQGVNVGWEILRDLVNMFFILVLLVVAFATVLNISKYTAKDILPRLIIIALLINFSLPMVFLVVDAAQITMVGFYNAMTNGLEGECKLASPGVCFSHMAMISKLLVDGADPTAAPPDADGWRRAGNLIMAIIFLFVFEVVMAAGAILMVVRIVGIWIAAIFSPLALFSKILPGTSFFFNTWLKKFLQYTFFGPLYVFFLWFSLILLQYVPKFGGIDPTYQIYKNAPLSDFFQFSTNILQFIMVVVLLLWSFLITRQMGIKYGEKIANNSEKFLKNAAWTVDRAVARGEIPLTGLKVPGLKRVLPYLSYGAQKRAWESRKQEAERSSYSKATGAIEEKIASFSSPIEALRTIGRSIPGFRKPKRYHYETLRHQGEVAKKQNEIASAVRDEDQLVNMAASATDLVEKEALYRQMAATNAFNTFFGNQGIEQTFENIKGHLHKVFGDKDGARIGAELAAIGIGSGNYTWAGMTKWDTKKGMIFGDIDNHKKVVRTKIRELEPQRFMGSLHPDSLFERDKQGKLADVSIGGNEVLRNLTADHIGQFNRMQLRTQIEMVRKIDQIQSRNPAAARAVLQRLLPSGIIDTAGNQRPLIGAGALDLTNAADITEIIGYVDRTYQR